MGRAVILVLDSFGIGSTDDAVRFGDAGADTLGGIARERAASSSGPLVLPNLARLGLFEASRASAGRYPAGVDTSAKVHGTWGYAEELSTGKDTPSGHWEIAGVPVLFDWGYFTQPTNTFPSPLLEELIERADLPGVIPVRADDLVPPRVRAAADQFQQRPVAGAQVDDLRDDTA